MADTEHLGTAALKERGWTPALIRDFLGKPDKLARNPYYRSAAPTQYWAKRRVEEAEATEAFLLAQAKAATRSAAGKARAEKMRAGLLERVRQMAVSVAPMPLDHLMVASLRHWQNGARDWEDLRDGSDAPPEVRQRWAVNYARHCRTHYDRALEDVAGKVGVNEAVQAIRAKVYAAIGEAWPDLAGECRRQMAARGIPLDEFMAQLSAERRERIEGRARDLIAQEAARPPPPDPGLA